MLIAKTRKWGSSLGVVIPRDVAEELNLKENEEVSIEITKKENPLKELFGIGSKNKITKEDFIKTRAILEEKL